MKNLFLILLLSVPTGVWAQSPTERTRQALPGKGSLLLGVSAGSGHGEIQSRHITARMQYFMTEGWSLALEGRYESNQNQYRGIAKNNFRGGSLSVRNYFLQTGRFAAFGQAGTTLGSFRSYDIFWCGVGLPDDYPSKRYHADRLYLQAQLGAGAYYRLNNRWSLEAGVERRLFDTNNFGCGGYGGNPDASSLLVNVGVNYRLR